MREQKWGRIINIHQWPRRSAVWWGALAASKAGNAAACAGLRARAGKGGYNRELVCPALIDREMVRSNPRANPSLIPIGRFGTAEEVASIVSCWLKMLTSPAQTMNATRMVHE